MRKNKLKLNDDKTEFIVFGTPSALKEVKTSSIQIGDHVTHLSSCVRNIGAHFDSTLKMSDQVQHVCKSAWYHLHQINSHWWCVNNHSCLSIAILVNSDGCSQIAQPVAFFEMEDLRT